MSIDPEDQFIETVKNTLAKNLFPEKKVRLPYAKLQSAAESRGLELDMILTRLEYDGIYGKIIGDKVVFADEEIEEVEAAPSFDAGAGASNPFAGGMPDAMKDMDFSQFQGGGDKSDMFAKAQEMMNQMTPEQMQAMQDMVQNMSPEERDKMMEQAKDMGI